MFIIKLKTKASTLKSYLKTPLLFEGHVKYRNGFHSHLYWVMMITYKAQMVLKI